MPAEGHASAAGDLALARADSTEQSKESYSVGDRVKVKPGLQHNEMTLGKTGTIVKIATPALGVKFDGMSGVHKWYVAEELEPE